MPLPIYLPTHTVCNKKSFYLISMLLCISLLCSACRQEVTPETVVENNKIELVPADLVSANHTQVQNTARFTGSIRAVNQSSLQAQVSATVTAVQAQVGQQVQKGQILLRLNNQDNQARLAQARANLASTQAQAKQSQNMLQRKKRLYDQGFIAKVEYEESLLDYQAQLENVRAQQANVDIALKAEQDGVIKSPMTGVITQRQVEPGQTVAIGQTLFEIVDPSQLEIQANIGTDQQQLLKLGQAIEFKIQGNPEQLSAVVSRISPVADLNSRQLEFFARPQQTINSLSIGAFVDGQLIAPAAQQGQQIPLNSIQKQNDQPYVWVIRQNKVAKADIQVLSENYNMNTAVIRGLKPDDQVSLVSFTEAQIGHAVVISQ